MASDLATIYGMIGLALFLVVAFAMERHTKGGDDAALPLIAALMIFFWPALLVAYVVFALREFWREREGR